MSEPIISFHNISYNYFNSNKMALEDFAIDIPRGSIWLLVGSIGSGKSTVLRLIRGFNKISGGNKKGEITIKGIELSNLDFYDIGRLGVGFVGQNPALNLHQLTVRDELLSSPIYNNLPWVKCIDLSNKIISLLDLEKLADRSPQDLSGGEMQKVAIGAALTMANDHNDDRHGILLLDEPESFLDSRGKRDLRNLFLNEYPAACCGWDGQETDLRKTAYLHLDD